MSTHRFDCVPEPPVRGTVLTHTTVREDSRRVRILLSGEIDLSSAEVLDVAVADALRSHQPQHVDIDLGHVSFIDSSGISALMRCRNQAIDAGCQLAVTNPQPISYQVLEVTGVLEALAVGPVAEGPTEC